MMVVDDTARALAMQAIKDAFEACGGRHFLERYRALRYFGATFLGATALCATRAR